MEKHAEILKNASKTYLTEQQMFQFILQNSIIK